MGWKKNLAIAAIPAIAGTGYGLYKHLYKPHQEAQELRRRGKKIRSDLKGGMPMMMAALAGAALAGGTAYGVSKFSHSPAANTYNPPTFKGKLNRYSSGLFGSTGLGHTGYDQQIIENSRRTRNNRQLLIDDEIRALQYGAPDHIKQMTRPLTAESYLDYYPTKLGSFQADTRIKQIINGITEEVPDKTATNWKAALALLGAGTALGALGYGEAKRYRKTKNIDAQLAAGRKKLDTGEFLVKHGVPIAVLAGSILGGAGGYASGVRGGRNQYEELRRSGVTNKANQFLADSMESTRKDLYRYY